jgi:cbb3-type cytochrome oxidase maturation protein
MSVLFIMLPIALLIAGVAVCAFARAAQSGQYDDLDTPACRMLLDDSDPSPPTSLVNEPPRKRQHD